MSPYWTGVLTVPALVAACAVAYLVARGALVLAARLTVVLVTVHAPDMPEHRAAVLGAGTYAARRGWFLAVGDLGVAVFAGQDPDRRADALNRLHQRPPLRTLARPPADD